MFKQIKQLTNLTLEQNSKDKRQEEDLTWLFFILYRRWHTEFFLFCFFWRVKHFRNTSHKSKTCSCEETLKYSENFFRGFLTLSPNSVPSGQCNLISHQVRTSALISLSPTAKTSVASYKRRLNSPSYIEELLKGDHLVKIPDTSSRNELSPQSNRDRNSK